MKPIKIILIILLGFLRTVLFSQIDSIKDVFPLGINYSWNYQYQRYGSHYNNFGRCYSYNDSGIVIYSVIDSNSTGDSIRWNIHTVWDIIVHYTENYPPSLDTTYHNIDSGNFTLWEIKSGKHHLFVDNIHYYVNPIWKFAFTFSDQYIYRFQSVDSSGKVYLNMIYTIYNYHFTFMADSGLLVLSEYHDFGYNAGTDVILLQGVISSVPGPIYTGQPPSQFVLSDNYPNPFNPSTQITYTVPKATNVTIKVYDVLCREIAVLVNERKQPGEYNVTWNAEGVPSGVYFYRLVAGDFIETRKMVVVK